MPLAPPLPLSHLPKATRGACRALFYSGLKLAASANLLRLLTCCVCKRAAYATTASRHAGPEESQPAGGQALEGEGGGTNPPANSPRGPPSHLRIAPLRRPHAAPCAHGFTPCGLCFSPCQVTDFNLSKFMSESARNSSSAAMNPVSARRRRMSQMRGSWWVGEAAGHACPRLLLKLKQPWRLQGRPAGMS